MKAPRILFAAALLGTLTALAWTEEDWRAARDWAACQREMAARGETLDLTAACDPIPPERNLERAPLFTHALKYTLDVSRKLPFPLRAKLRLPYLYDMPSPSEEHYAGTAAPLSAVYAGERVDLRAWQAIYRQHSTEFGLAAPSGALLPAPAEDVLRALETFAPIMDDVEHSAAMMPDGVFSLAPTSANLEPYGAIRRIVQTLTLRGSAHLAAGQNAEARHDMELILWLRQGAVIQPRRFLNVALGCSYLEMALQIVWEGLADHRWNADDLADIQHRLQSLDLLADYRRAASGQGAILLLLTDGSLDGRYKYADLLEPGDGWGARISAWALMHGPNGWLVRNRITITRFFHDDLMKCVDVSAHRFHPEAMDAGDDKAVRICTAPVWPWRYLMATGMPGFLRVVERCGLTQTALDEAVVACAIERYALAHGGAQPADLEALVPEYLDHVPASVMDGTPLRYTPTPGGRYLLKAPLPVRETEKPPGFMVQGDELVWGYPSGH